MDEFDTDAYTTHTELWTYDQLVILPPFVYILFCFGLLTIQVDIKQIYANYNLLKLAVHFCYTYNWELFLNFQIQIFKKNLA
jgi:hypothetical protein